VKGPPVRKNRTLTSVVGVVAVLGLLAGCATAAPPREDQVASLNDKLLTSDDFDSTGWTAGPNSGSPSLSNDSDTPMDADSAEDQGCGADFTAAFDTPAEERLSSGTSVFTRHGSVLIEQIQQLPNAAAETKKLYHAMKNCENVETTTTLGEVDYHSKYTAVTERPDLTTGAFTVTLVSISGSETSEAEFLYLPTGDILVSVQVAGTTWGDSRTAEVDAFAHTAIEKARDSANASAFLAPDGNLYGLTGTTAVNQISSNVLSAYSAAGGRQHARHRPTDMLTAPPAT
jgi:hypothetical protein